MSSAVADVNRDGRMDVFVTNIYLPRATSGAEPPDRHGSGQMELVFEQRLHGNNLLVNRGNGTFVDRAREYGVRKGGWGWAAVFADFDNDGRTDLFQANQVITARREFSIAVDESPYLATPMLWHRTADGFERLNATRAGLVATDGRGAAGLDFDRDGDRDVVVGNNDGPFRLYENVGAGGTDDHWLALRVDGASGGPALGARVSVTVDGRTTVHAVTARSDYLSQGSRVVHVGLGANGTVDRLRIVWPDGTERSFENVPTDRRLRVSPDGIGPVSATRTNGSDDTGADG